MFVWYDNFDKICFFLICHFVYIFNGCPVCHVFDVTSVTVMFWFFPLKTNLSWIFCVWYTTRHGLVIAHIGVSSSQIIKWGRISQNVCKQKMCGKFMSRLSRLFQRPTHKYRKCYENFHTSTFEAELLPFLVNIITNVKFNPKTY